MKKKPRKPVKKAPAKKPARKVPRKAAKRPRPATSFRLKELKAEHVEVLRRHFGGIQAHDWRLVVDATGRPLKPPPAATPGSAAAPADQAGTKTVLFAMAMRTSIDYDG